MALLTEKYADLLNSRRHAPIAKKDIGSMALILENENKHLRELNENTVSADVAQFIPIFMPLARKVMPCLIANEIAGIQPLKMAQGYIFSLAFRYTNETNEPVAPVNESQIVELKQTTGTVAVGDELTFTKGTSTIVAKVLYLEGNLVLINKSGVTATSGATTSSYTGTNLAGDVVATYSNELSFAKVFKDYAGYHTTDAGEKLSTDMKEVGFNIERVTVEAKTNKLKAKYTLELYQDLKAIHGLNADEELMNMMALEVQSEIDRRVIDFMNTTAKPVADFDVTGMSGRYEMEKFAHILPKIKKEAVEIGKRNRLGQANKLIASPTVVAMLSALKGFRPIETDSKIGNKANVAKVGNFAGLDVIQDQFAERDYITLTYCGEDRRSAGIYYAPYQPISFVRVVDAESGQPAIILTERSAITENPLGNDLYSSTFAVLFSNGGDSIKSLA